jgi:hypothetical protein
VKYAYDRCKIRTEFWLEYLKGQGHFEDRGLIGGQQVLEMNHEEVWREGTH